MEISRDEEKKMIFIWMTKADQQDEACQRQAKGIIEKWHEKGWLPVVLRSGEKDLQEMTSALLVNNRRSSARKAAECQSAEKKASVYEKLSRPVIREKRAAAVRKSRDDVCL